MIYRPGDTLHVSFTTQSMSGAATDADSTPTVSLRRNGTIDSAVTVSVAHNATGDYTASAAIPLTYTGGDELELVVSATVGGVAAKEILPLGKLDRTAQAVAQVIYRTGRVHFISAAGNSAHDGFSPETAKALPSQPSPSAGDTILVFSGTFPIDTAIVDLSGDGTTGVHMLGAAMGATVITSNALLTGPGAIVKPGNGSQICDLTVQGIAAIGGSHDQYQAPLGASTIQTPFAGAIARRLQLIGDSDGIYVEQSSSAITLRAYDCVFQTKYDAVNVLASATSRFELHNCHLIAAGPSTCNSGTVARALAVRAGTLEMYGGTLAASGASTTTRAAQTTSTGVANLYGVEMQSASSSGTIYDLDNSGTSLAVYDCTYAPAKTTGAIFAENVTPTLAAAQSFNNAGQTTPLPSTTSFTGPNSVTFIFHDATGNPVGGVVFTVDGLGSAVADSSGSRALSLPTGTFTIQALPAAGVFWPDTSITITGAITHTFTGTAISIPAPTSPSQTTAYLTTRDAQGAALGAVTLTFQLVDPQAASDSYNQSIFTVTSDSGGSLQVALLKSTKYQARVGGGAWVPFTTGYDATFALPEILGTYT